MLHYFIFEFWCMLEDGMGQKLMILVYVKHFSYVSGARVY